MLTTGVFIVAMLSVLLGGPAFAASLRNGDVILALATLAMGMVAGNGLGWLARLSNASDASHLKSSSAWAASQPTTTSSRSASIFSSASFRLDHQPSPRCHPARMASSPLTSREQLIGQEFGLFVTPARGATHGTASGADHGLGSVYR